MRWIGLAALGLGGMAILLFLGIWQLQRLEWKSAILADMEARIEAAPTEVPEAADPEDDNYLPVTAEGETTGEELHFLVSTEATGAGFRIVAPFETDGRRLMIDLGITSLDTKEPPRPAQAMTVIGNLHWPQETDRFTPDPETDGNIWFARDVSLMAAALDSEPVLIVARETTPPVPQVVPMPVGTEGIPNDHLQYAITWFSIAALWAGMTVLLGWRMARPRS